MAAGAACYPVGTVFQLRNQSKTQNRMLSSKSRTARMSSQFGQPYSLNSAEPRIRPQSIHARKFLSFPALVVWGTNVAGGSSGTGPGAGGKWKTCWSMAVLRKKTEISGAV
jgi:hypothetical protein